MSPKVCKHRPVILGTIPEDNAIMDWLQTDQLLYVVACNDCGLIGKLEPVIDQQTYFHKHPDMTIQELRRLIELGMVRVRMGQFWDTKHWDMEHVGDLYFLDEESKWVEWRM